MSQTVQPLREPVLTTNCPQLTAQAPSPVMPAPVLSYPPRSCHSRESGNPARTPHHRSSRRRHPLLSFPPRFGHARPASVMPAQAGIQPAPLTTAVPGAGTRSCHSHPASVMPAPLLSFPPLSCHSRESGNPARTTIRFATFSVRHHDVHRIHGAFNRA